MQSGGVCTAEPPDVCLTPGPTGSPVPLPYVNSAMSSDLIEGSQSVTIDGSPVAVLGSKFAKSTGDEPGVIGGLMSGTNMSMAEFTTGSPTVCIEGEPVCRLSDKMSMNNSNTVTSAGLVQAPIPPSQPLTGAFAPDKPQVCTLHRLTVKCSHGERSYIADTEKAHFIKLGVISSSKPEKLTIDYKNHCSIHPEGCAKLWVRALDGTDRKVGADNTIEFPLAKNSLAELATWWDLLKAIFSWSGRSSIPHTAYTIYGTTCQATEDAAMITGQSIRLHVYPGWSLSADAWLGYKHKKVDLPKGHLPNAPQLTYQLKKQATWELGGKVSGNIATRAFEQKWSSEGDGATATSDPLSRKLFALTQGTLNNIANMLSSFAGLESTKFDIRWPKMTLGGSLKLAENKENGDVFPEGRFFFGAEPLLGAEVRVDILDWLIIALGAGLFPPAGAALGRMLVRAKSRLKDGLTPRRVLVDGQEGLQDVKLPADLKVDLGVVFTMGGDVGGALGWVFDADGVHPDDKKSKIQAGIDIKLEAYIKVELRVFIVKAAAGASVAMQSADGKSPSRISGSICQKPGRKPGAKSKNGTDFDLTGQIEFNGLAIYYSLYLEISGEAKEGAVGKASGGAAKWVRSKAKKKFKKEGDLCKLIEPWVLPKPGENIFSAL